MTSLIDALHECEEYFDQRADADQPVGSGPIPNEEMRLLIVVRDALSALVSTPPVSVGELVERLRIGSADNPSYEVVWVQNLREHFKSGMFSRSAFPEWNDIFLTNVNALLAAAEEAASALTAANADRDRLEKELKKADATIRLYDKTFTQDVVNVQRDRDRLAKELEEAREVMLVSASIPAPFHLMAAESAGPTKDGSYSWRAWVRQPNLGQFRGGTGFTLQEAVDRATANLQRTLAAQEDLRPKSSVQGLKLNLEALGLK